MADRVMVPADVPPRSGPMRPPPIVWFERTYLLNVALGAMSMLAYWSELRRVAPAGLLAASATIFLAVFVILTLLVARRRSQVAKWILVLLALLALSLSLPSLPASLAAG